MKVILTGATGMVGEGVLIECLEHSEVEKVLCVNRKSTGYSHPKLEEYIVSDFLKLNPTDDNLRGYDACFYCAGVSSVGMDEADYYRITYKTTIHFAEVLSRQNPEMMFLYVSGSGTDSSEKGRLMWARVKGKTENDLLKMPFKKVYNFRPALLKATSGQQNVLSYYKYINWLFPILNVVYPGGVSTLKQLGLAMINVAQQGYNKQVLEVRDIKKLAD